LGDIGGENYITNRENGFNICQALRYDIYYLYHMTITIPRLTHNQHLGRGLGQQATENDGDGTLSTVRALLTLVIRGLRLELGRFTHKTNVLGVTIELIRELIEETIFRIMQTVGFTVLAILFLPCLCLYLRL